DSDPPWRSPPTDPAFHTRCSGQATHAYDHYSTQPPPRLGEPLTNYGTRQLMMTGQLTGAAGVGAYPAVLVCFGVARALVPYYGGSSVDPGVMCRDPLLECLVDLHGSQKMITEDLR